MASKPKPIIPYFGGKSRVAKQIVKLFPAHKTYAEPFAGGLSILLTKEPSKCEVVNDYDTELLHLYKMIKFRLAELLEGIEKIPHSRKMFEEWLHQDPTYLNDVYRAVRKLYIIRMSFGGKAANFGRSDRARFDAGKIRGWIEDFWKRTNLVQFECLDAVDFIQLYDSPATFFYIDPVYLGKDYYGQKFGGVDRHRQLRDVLAKVKGKWLLSHHQEANIEELYKRFNIGSLTVPYSLNKGSKKPVKELLISNY